MARHAVGLLLMVVLAKVSAFSHFYPYGVSTGDSANPLIDDGGSPSVPIVTSFAFFERTYQALFVNNNGVISFEVAVSEFTSQAFPLSDGRAFISPFWADVDNRHKGQVLYRETTSAENLQKATEDVRLYFADFQDFSATWVFIATWDNVTYYGGSSVTAENTFQAVLITNGTSSFAMFNYGNITWTTGTASGGAGGVGGTPAQAGFNSGGSTHYFNIPGSRTADIINVEMTSNVNYPGRWIFRTDAFGVAGGCYANGKMLKYGDVYWSDDNCTMRCKCVGGEVANGLQCNPRTCSDSEHCVLRDGLHQCTPQETRMCTVSGDPHYHTFDGVVHHFQGTCAYTLARTCSGSARERPAAGGGTASTTHGPTWVAGVTGTANTTNATTNNVTTESPSGMSSFHVIAKSEHRGSNAVSWTKMVRLEVYGISLTINKGDNSRVLVNEELISLPFTMLNGSIRASQSGFSVAISTDFGLIVTYDADHYATIVVPGAFKGRLCGVCGNYNDNEQDEFTMPNGTVTTSVTEFGESWVQDPDCDDVVVPPPTCSEAVLNTYRGDSFCGLISNPNGPLATCDTIMSSFNFLESCVFDMCATGGNRAVLCQSLSAFVSTCQSHGVTIRAWRDQVNCSMTCGANMAYQLCGTACPATCGDSTAPNFCTRPCTESCQCSGGFLLSGSACVAAGTGCGCMHEGSYHHSGDTWLSAGCASRCRCDQGGRVACAEPGCGGGERCQLRNGTLECAAGRVGAECSVFGDPHYRTFDGLAFDFMGTCRYTLATSGDAAARALEPFAVEVENENRERLCVSWTKEVTVRAYGQEVKLLKTLTHRVLVNGLYVDLPLSLAAGRLRVFQSANGALLLTEFGLEVAFDGHHAARLRVPQEYAGLTRGLCGNYDGNAADDLRLPGGQLSAGVAEFGDAWRVAGGELTCRDDVARPPCAPAGDDPQHLGGGFCGFLLREDGPFALCHGHVNVTEYFDDCVLDAGATQGDTEVLCRALEGYVEACQAAAVAVSPWRNNTFCPKRCGPNSHYEVCTSSCPESCTSQTRCDLPCHEGCKCDAGHVLSGVRCVPASQCGCSHGGSYRPLHEPFWEGPGCSRRCTCSAGGTVFCEAAACGPATVCGVRGGEVACVPEDGPAFCQAAGDPHYYTFDGATFDFMGACRYTLVKTCGGGGGAVAFNVEVENDDRGSLVVSYTNLVQVDVYGHSIVISRADYPKVRVDGVLVNMPVTIIPGNLTIRASNAALVETNFGLRVQYDGNHIATVWLPRDYRGLTCGLCGNFNGNMTDDFLLPNGSLAQSQNNFGQAWTVSDSSCQAPGPLPEPCPDAQRLQYAGSDFCGVLVKPEGPFAECQLIVRPGPHFQSCVTDVCALGGRVSALCDALAAYASACAAAGVTVSGWRNGTVCPLTCQAHSHYTTCSNSCQPSCSDPQGSPSPQCGGDGGLCFEGCVCDGGHVLSGAACVPQSQCGCVDPSSGRYYQPGDSFWADDSCQRRCSCAAGGALSCRAAECGPYERCGLENGVAGCHPTGSATCSFYTDPHYVTFDGRSYDYHGTCTYVMVRPRGNYDGVVPPFEVLGKNDQRGSSISWPYSVSLSAYGHTVTVTRQHANRILVNGTVMSLNWALPSKQIWAVVQGGSAEIMTDFGLRLTYNWRNHVSITIPSSLIGLTCGLCGKYNGDPSDDFALPDGTTAPSVNEFAGSWRAEAVAEDQGCVGGGDAPTPPPLPMCAAADRERYGGEAFCGVIRDAAGPMRGCHAAVDPGTFFESCVRDVCLYGGQREILCQALEAYVVVCQAADGSVNAWRNNSFCPMSCPSNGHYELCGDACHSSCSDLAHPVACTPRPCSESCRCDRGFVLRSGLCVALAECGCFHSGRNYAGGEVFWPDALCRQRCTCRRDGTTACEETDGCGVGETCGVRAGARVCQPAGRASCRVWSDPHYVTFDGVAFDFQGACTYTLARNCSHELPHFEVTARNGNLGSPAVSVPRQVTVTVYGQRVDMFAEGGANVQVNGLNRNLPVSHNAGRLSVYRSGSSTVVATDFGLQVSYNHRYHVTLEVASTFQNKLCGLCGNYNLNATDEFLSPEGRPVSDPVQFGVSWKADNSSGCRDEGGALPACGAEQRALYQSSGYCGILTSPDGPFAGCHATVNPAGYYESCVFDLCALGGSADLLAGALETYTEACQSAGAPVEVWRNDTLGQLSCPPHSHYKLCGTGCPSSCTDLAGPAACVRPCAEGCQCDTGYVWSGAQCVAVAQCGCNYNGRYLQAGEVVWGTNCSELCECLAGGVTRCSPASCPAGLSCSARGGALGCYQETAARCTITNDPHYFTFDGAVVHYQGVCAYDVARPCRGGGVGGVEPPAFRVIMENKRRGPSAVSFISAVHLHVGSARVLLRGQEVLVNGVSTHLPAIVAQGIILAQEGDLVVARTPLNVSVFYDRLYTAHVEVGAKHAGLLCGMCGNYNGNPRDDLLTPSGEIALDAGQFGRSWRATDVDASCRDTENHVEPGRCNEEEMQDHCGVLSDREGPFWSCHQFVNPALYLDSCVYDLCSYEATKVQLCRALAAYAQACSLAGVPLSDWRNRSGCPASDPCSTISCGEREWCGSNSGIYGCYCDEIPTGESVDYTLNCEATTMDIALSSCQLFHKGFTAQHLHLNSLACRGNNTGGRVSFSTILSINNDCGSEVTTNATHIIYTNAVRGVVDLSTNPAITQEKKIAIAFGCAYPIENNASSTPVLPTVNNTEITIPTQPGKFILQMRLYKSDAFTSFHESAVNLSTNSFLHVGITLSGGDPARFKEQIRDCWATPTADPNHRVRFNFITNSCPATQDDSVKIIENGVSHFSKLSMKVFKFVGNYNQVHLHCRVAVCDSQATTCTKKCSLRSLVPDSETDTKIMTLGPIEKIEENPTNSEGQNAAAFKPARLSAALLLPLALAAAVLV